MHTSIYHAGYLATTDTPIMRGKQMCTSLRKLLTHTLRNSTASHGFAA